MKERTVEEMVNHRAGLKLSVAALAMMSVLASPVRAFASDDDILKNVQSRQEVKRVVSNVSSEMVESYVEEPLELASDTLESLYGISPEISITDRIILIQ